MKISLERRISQEGGEKRSCLSGQKTRLKINSFMSRLQMMWKVPPATNSQDNYVVSCSEFPEAHCLFKCICLSITPGLAQHIQGQGCHMEVRYWIWCPHTAFGVKYTPASKHWALLRRKSLLKAVECGILRHLPVNWVLWRTGSQNRCSLATGQMQRWQQRLSVHICGRCNCSRPSASASNTC